MSLPKRSWVCILIGSFVAALLLTAVSRLSAQPVYADGVIDVNTDDPADVDDANCSLIEAIIAANPGLDPNRLQIGQTICIPMDTPSPCPENTMSYTIRTGDTFYRISQVNNVSLDALLAANPGIDPDRLQVGQVICIPAST